MVTMGSCDVSVQRSTAANDGAAPIGMSCSPATPLRSARHHRYRTDDLFGRCLLRFADVRLDLGLMVAHIPRKRFTDAGMGG
jgi:hypothetical protein